MFSRIGLTALTVALLIPVVAAQTPLQRTETGAGFPVVLLGGGLLGADGWGGVPERLAKRHRVINAQSLVVQYGLENRDLPPDYTLTSEVEALKVALDASRVDSADFIGMSQGGVIAMVFALTYPQRVRTLAVVEPPAFWVLPNHGRNTPGAREMQEFITSLKNATITEAHVERFRCLLGDCTGGRSPRSAPAWNIWVTHRNALRGLHTSSNYDDDPQRLRNLSMPVLVVTGAETVAFHREMNQILLRLLPRATPLEMTGGHNSPTSDPDYFVAQWETFSRR
jgi:pimeloyl-ACP methyl ester carboxylesterase